MRFETQIPKMVLNININIRNVVTADFKDFGIDIVNQIFFISNSIN